MNHALGVSRIEGISNLNPQIQQIMRLHRLEGLADHVLVRRSEAFEFFKPVEDDGNLVCIEVLYLKH